MLPIVRDRRRGVDQLGSLGRAAEGRGLGSRTRISQLCMIKPPSFDRVPAEGIRWALCPLNQTALPVYDLPSWPALASC